jgi:YVTN family beta-propeller protein
MPGNNARAIGLSLLSSVVFAIGVRADTPSATGLKVIGHISGPDGGWDYATVDADARRLYVAHGDTVMAVDLDNGKVTPSLVAASHAHGIALVTGTTLAVSTNGAANSVTVFDTVTGKVAAEIPTGGKSPDAIVYDPATGLVLVMNHRSGDVALVDPRALKVVGMIAVGGTLEFAVVDGKGRAYVNVEDKNEIAVIDTRGRKLLSRIALKDCDGPSGLAYDPDTDVLVSACGNGVAKVLAATAGTDVATLKIGSRPDAVMVDVARRVFYVPNGGDGTLSVIAERSATDLRVVDTVTTQVGARTGAVDPKTGRVYLPVAKSWLPGTVGMLTPKSGTFELLVVGR